MVACKYFPQGNCKFGNNCRYEHTGQDTVQGAFEKSPFPTFANQSSSQSAASMNFSVTRDLVEADLTRDLPTWILSSYGPGRDAPEQLFGGSSREQSFEEARLFYEVESAQGRQQHAQQELSRMYQNAADQIQNVLQNLDQAVQFVIDSKDKHPNRFDIIRQSAPERATGESSRDKLQQEKQQSSGSFRGSGGSGLAPSTASSAFGAKPLPFGGGSSGGGSGGFGSTSSSAFAQTSALSSSMNRSAFGQTSPFGSGASTATPSFGKPAFGSPGFGQPSKLGQTQSIWGSGAFSSLSKTNSKSAFVGGQQTSSSLGFGQAQFGQASGLGLKPSPFSSASPFSQATQAQQTTSGFSQNQSSASPFTQAAQNQQQQSSPFGQAHQQQQQTSSPFGQPQQPSGFASAGGITGKNPFGSQTQTNGFGASVTPQTTAFSQTPRQKPQQQQPQGESANPYPANSAAKHPPSESYMQKDMNGRLTTFKGKSVSYKPDPFKKESTSPTVPGYLDKGAGAFGSQEKWIKIWFPAGPPVYNKDTEGPDPGKYTNSLKQAYQEAIQKSVFTLGQMPDVPPMRQWCLWDF